MFNSQTVGSIIVAAGRGERMGGIDKIFAPLCGVTVLERVVTTFEVSTNIDHIVIVLNQESVERGERLLGPKNLTKVLRSSPAASAVRIR